MARISALWRPAHPARHRLGAPGLVHCAEHPEVAAALSALRRRWLAALLVPARHSWIGVRRRALVARRRLAPAS